MGIVRRALLIGVALALAVPASATAIIGGTAAPDAGSTVKLRTAGPAAGHCSGSLILPSVVLTAAHCVNDVTGVEVTTGRATISDQSAGQVFQAVRWTTTPGYALSTGHDLAYVDLGADSVAPVATLQNFVPAPGYVVTARGYGQTVVDGPASDTLQQADLRVAPCTSNIPAWQFCTKVGAGFTASPCHGDSGGPVLSGTGLLLGVMSAASAGCANVSAMEPVSADVDFIAQARSPRISGRMAWASPTGAVPLAGTIRVLRADGSVAGQATADATGAFQVVVPQGTYDVEASAPGYATTTTRGLFVGGPTSFTAALAPPPPPVAAPQPKAKVSSIVRRRDGKPAVRVAVTPAPGVARTRLSVIGVLQGKTAKAKRYALGTVKVTVTRKRTITVVLPTKRSVRAKVKVGSRVQIGVFAGDAVLANVSVKVKKG